MSTNPWPFAFTSLVEPNETVDPPGAPFDAGMAYFLGQCCELTYTQLSSGSVTASQIEALEMAGTLAGYTASVSNLTPITVSEAIGPVLPSEPATYVSLPAGFGAEVTFTGSNTFAIAVIALRGTQSWQEWLDDADAVPAPFAGVFLTNDGLGSVHAGFYGYYTVGTDGSPATPGSEVSSTVSDRAGGSIAQQVGTFVQTLTNASLYVTGHSLGGAIAGLCALDVAYNFTGSGGNPVYASTVSAVTLASPRIAVGVSDTKTGLGLPTLGNQQMLVANFQSLVQTSWAIVHACDIVPILPSDSAPVGALTLGAQQVTAPVSAPGSGASATASVSNGAVTSISVTNSGSDYLSTAPPVVVLSGGGGSGATAYPSDISVFGHLDGITVVSGGSGYTSAPAVQILDSLATTVVNFCAQTGDVGGNHSCQYTYVPYLQQLANEFS